MSVDTWNTLTEGISRQLEGHAKDDELYDSVKTFLKIGLGKDDSDIEKLEQEKKYVCSRYEHLITQHIISISMRDSYTYAMNIP